MLRGVHRLRGFTIHAIDGELGKVEDFYFDYSDRKIHYAIVKLGGMFQSRDVLICVSELGPSGLSGVASDLTVLQIQTSPEIDSSKPLSRDQDEELQRHYGIKCHLYSDDKVSSLRRISSLTNFTLIARDGEAGRVEDIIIDDEIWLVKYLVISTGSWTGKRVLVDISMSKKIDWEQSKIEFDLPKGKISDSPKYDPFMPILPEHEIELKKYFENDNQ
jgi:sporulation protein YlmC with PRC-barrel domain